MHFYGKLRLFFLIRHFHACLISLSAFAPRLCIEQRNTNCRQESIILFHALIFAELFLSS